MTNKKIVAAISIYEKGQCIASSEYYDDGTFTETDGDNELYTFEGEWKINEKSQLMFRDDDHGWPWNRDIQYEDKLLNILADKELLGE